MNQIISVRNLGKKYIISENIHGRGASTFRDIFDYKTKRLFRKDVNRRKEDTTLWALKDVSFDVDQGEVVGIIGRNGAGKSTLLKILSRITEPTEGAVTLRGRVASLLEVGTGFSGELTGRENIFFNGSILGMKKKEIGQKFDEIVAFAEVEKFIDTPVKRYSSGMYVRLAFAVAAHLEPEILLVDEVLAVGDVGFQKKCLGKLKDVSYGGRTVLLVSHNMAAITNLCRKAILLRTGQIEHIGRVNEVVEEYLATIEEGSSICVADRLDRRGDGRLRVQRVVLTDGSGRKVDYLQSGRDATVMLEYTTNTGEWLHNVLVNIAIDGPYGERLLMLQNDYVGNELTSIPPHGFLACHIPNLPLAAGSYPFTIYIEVSDIVADWVINAGRLRVEVGDYYGTGRYPDTQDGHMLVKHEWSVFAQGDGPCVS